MSNDTITKLVMSAAFVPACVIAAGALPAAGGLVRAGPGDLDAVFGKVRGLGLQLSRIGLAVLLLGIASCGGGSGTAGPATPDPDPVSVAVAVFPSTDVLGPEGVRTFQANVYNTSDSRVTWTVLEGASGGSIDSVMGCGSSCPNFGKYTAPNRTGVFHVIVTSTFDPSASATATITVVPAGFRPADDMGLARGAHTATLLPNGQVLVTGGDPCSTFSILEGEYLDPCPLEEAELYDPADGVFISTGNMFAKRSLHTATLLPSGKVLIAGGGATAAELYDPITGAFAPTGSMNVNRAAHTATLLSNGRVLIVGGAGNGATLSIAEIYDPQTGTFSPTGGAGMTAPRSWHTATRLGNERVLISGGMDSSDNVHLTAELYDPVTETFIATGSMQRRRARHTATLLGNGTVLLTAGAISGGFGQFDTAEIYDPSSGTFSMTGRMPSVRYAHFAVLLSSGNVLVSGGEVFDLASMFGYTAEIYDPAAGTFVQTGSMEFNRIMAVPVTLADGRVLVIGGSQAASAELYQ